MERDLITTRTRGSGFQACEVPTWALLVPIAIFYLNDLAFIALQTTHAIYLADYLFRIAALIWIVCVPGLFLAARQAPSSNTKIPEMFVWAVLLTFVFLVIDLRFSHSVSVGDAWHGAFQFPTIQMRWLKAFDLSVGILLVALSEEVIFRRLLFKWFQQRGCGTINIVVLSAACFALAHWGVGLANVMITFAFGVLAMTVYLRCKRLWPVVIPHFLIDFFNFA